MKIKRFFAKDIRTALDEIKISLGPDAIIMSNKNVDGGVEIVAAIDEDNNAVIPNRVKKPKGQAAPSPVRQPASSASAFAENMREQVNEQQLERRVMNEDRVSLSGFQQRLIKQQTGQKKPAELPLNSMAGTDINVHKTPIINQQDKLPEWAKWIQHSNPSPQDVAAAGISNQPNISPTISSSSAVDSADLQELKLEMASMRQLLQHQVSGLMEQDASRRDPTRAMLMKDLVRIGFESDIAQQLLVDIGPSLDMRHAKQILASTMLQRLSTTHNDILEHGGVVALLGPTGVGKTTTVAKLAARFAMKFGSDQVAMITTDSYRIGAFEQLNTYGKILGAPVRVAKDAQQLADAIYQSRHKKLVLIDTAGMGQRDVRLNEQLSTLMSSSHVNIRSYLVLPATAQRMVLQEAIIQFRKMPLAGCIITKMDEAISASEILSVAIGHSLPIGYLTNGQRVPEDIGVADLNNLINSVIEQLGVNTQSTTTSSNPTHFASMNR